MKIFEKYKSFMSDMVLNIIGFGIYVVAQQILLLPLLAKMVNDDIYSSIVLYISILNVVCNVTGGELGNVRLVENSNYKKKNVIGDFSRILVVISFFITIALFPIFKFYMKYSIIGTVLLILTILMANVRLYSTCYYRLEGKYNKVIWQNVCYLVGIITSLILFKLFGNIYLLLFIPEFISVIYAFKNSDILEMKLVKTVQMVTTLKKFFKLGIVSTLTNLMAYFDKFMIYPMFGATSVAVYYAVNSMSKIANLIVNPVSNVILSWVSGSKGQNKQSQIIKTTMILNIPVLIGVAIITMPLTYLALKILYSQYMMEASALIIPISITTAFGTAATLIKSVLLKYSNTNRLVGIYIMYFVVFVILGYKLSQMYDILGFAVANLIAKVILWIGFIILLLTSKNSKEENNDEQVREQIEE